MTIGLFKSHISIFSAPHIHALALPIERKRTTIHITTSINLAIWLGLQQFTDKLKMQIRKHEVECLYREVFGILQT